MIDTGVANDDGNNNNDNDDDGGGGGFPILRVVMRAAVARLPLLQLQSNHYNRIIFLLLNLPTGY